MSSQRVVQFTDTHLLSDPEAMFLGLNTQESFTEVLEHIKTHQSNADLLICTGDIAQDEALPTYERFAEQVAGLNKTTCWIPGNHDDPILMTNTLGETGFLNNFHYALAHWDIICLDSKFENKVEGMFSDEAIDELTRFLAKPSERPIGIFTHHHLLSVGQSWNENIGVMNSDVLLALLPAHPRIKFIASGHLHQDHMTEYHDIPFYISPSTSVQFKPHTDSFALDDIPPGYRFFELHDNGEFDTTVVRVEECLLRPDLTRKGY